MPSGKPKRYSRLMQFTVQVVKTKMNKTLVMVITAIIYICVPPGLYREGLLLSLCHELLKGLCSRCIWLVTPPVRFIFVPINWSQFYKGLNGLHCRSLFRIVATG